MAKAGFKPRQLIPKLGYITTPSGLLPIQPQNGLTEEAPSSERAIDLPRAQSQDREKLGYASRSPWAGACFLGLCSRQCY